MLAKPKIIRVTRVETASENLTKITPAGNITGNKNRKSCIGESGYIKRQAKEENTQVDKATRGMPKEYSRDFSVFCF